MQECYENILLEMFDLFHNMCVLICPGQWLIGLVCIGKQFVFVGILVIASDAQGGRIWCIKDFFRVPYLAK